MRTLIESTIVSLDRVVEAPIANHARATYRKAEPS